MPVLKPRPVQVGSPAQPRVAWATQQVGGSPGTGMEAWAPAANPPRLRVPLIRTPSLLEN